MENKNNAKLFCLLLPKFISDSYFVDKNVDKISQFRLGDNSQKSQQNPSLNPQKSGSVHITSLVSLISLEKMMLFMWLAHYI